MLGRGKEGYEVLVAGKLTKADFLKIFVLLALQSIDVAKFGTSEADFSFESV
jgi:hypothetical protein